ncbi:tyrosine-type recombinase/integrase [Bradyrhizobium sp. USDA 3311]
MGFPDTCIPLPPGASDEEIGELCRGYTAQLRSHIEAEKKKLETNEPSLTRTRYDGTIKTACQIYQEHPNSAFNYNISDTTRRGYLADLKVIIESVGHRRVKNCTVLDVQAWYREWRKGVEYIDDGERWFGPERIARAHNAVAMVRTVLRFMAALRHADCKLLAEELAKIQFEREGAREQELTYQQVRDFVRAAGEMVDKGLISRDRALYLSIATAAQFELMLRQGDIIGKWQKRKEGAKFPAGIALLHTDNETWAGFFTWEKIPGWRWRTRTSKSKYRAAVEFDLQIYDLLFPLLEQVPMEERTGAIIKGELGQPIRYRTFVKAFRKIAQVAKIPDEVWSMDARAGGAGEADDAGVDTTLISAGLTHTNVTTTGRYLRNRAKKKIVTIAEARKQARAGGENGGNDDGA